MDKSKVKDISFDTEIQISSTKSKFPKSKYLDILIVFLGVIGGIYVFINSFGLEHNNYIIIGSISFSVLIFSFVFYNREILNINM